ncbi:MULTISPECIES: YtnP family quorum-quenching lactonase [Ureibacillus]|jgi:glyoxylase-like metal-dependent hydrolase (beta-lactamase superfamily II)|uniref:Glyoxylase-like metal-dependent hydrolase (Beta-lactamase superfamily II) n=1 Tax=Ureibacillus thermosphaericus TaxID=51173 RepID=A0A840PZ40_URETH|nr:MBL fold metallo-hydrolase [Ureibacillus thermosphaericus]MBB5148116.1 glyoxylase-like metal-dependent hydrolase (beta-lactamase superfamily II) [Ureibacillus thermosphaericus]NKZ30827.1 MBL fold metallo-hydrolase [Ureibacillus thermosphaericus]
MDKLHFHDMTLTWLDGGVTSLDGGAMFGVVPKPLWSRKYPVNEKNQIELACEPILIQYNGKNYMIDSGIGNKLNEKQIRNYGVTEQSNIEESLQKLGMTVEDIDGILMTHMHFDHASGLTKYEGDRLVSTFPKAKIYVSQIEWDEMRNPNIRSKATYWAENWEPIQDQVVTFTDFIEVAPGIEMIHTGGHSDGHAIVKLKQKGETLIHMADIMPTHAHQNPLWVMAYDDYPMTSIFAKEKLLKEAYTNGYKFIFYHDAYYRMVQWDESGKDIIDSLKRSKEAKIQF